MPASQSAILWDISVLRMGTLNTCRASRTSRARVVPTTFLEIRRYGWVVMLADILPSRRISMVFLAERISYGLGVTGIIAKSERAKAALVILSFAGPQSMIVKENRLLWGVSLVVRSWTAHGSGVVWKFLLVTRLGGCSWRLLSQSLVVPCGSVSIKRTGRVLVASTPVRLMAIVDFPTPPLLFDIVTIGMVEIIHGERIAVKSFFERWHIKGMLSLWFASLAIRIPG